MGMHNKKSQMGREPRANVRPDYLVVAGSIDVPKEADSPYAGTSWLQFALTSKNTQREFNELPAVVEFNNYLFKKVTKSLNDAQTQEIAHYKKVDDAELARAVRKIYIEPEDLL